VAISGAVGVTHTTTATTKADNGSTFAVVATNSLGTAASAPATLTVQWAPTITTQPGSQTVTAGQPAVFTVTADGNPTPSYQWQRDGQNISGATGTTYTMTTTLLADSGATITVVISNGLGSLTSNSTSLTVNPAPVAPAITTQPLATTVQAGQLASFSVLATGTAPLTYQWRKNSSAVPTGGTTSTFSIASAQVSDAGTYDVVINNLTNQPVTSNGVALTVNPAPVAPSINTQPLDVAAVEGNSASFTVVASGSAPLSYQWQKNLTDIPSATQANYTLSAATLADSGASFRCRVSNTVGPIYSNAAVLTVTPAPQAPVITTFSATPSTMTLGQPTMLSWAVTGASSLSLDNGIGSVTGLTSKQVTPSNTGTYTYLLTATNGVGSTPASTQVVVTAASAYPLTVSLPAGVTGAPATTTSYPQGTVVNYTYALQTGYTTLQVTLDGTAVAPSGTVTMNGAHTLAATAQIQTYGIWPTAGTNGTISPSATTIVNYGGNQTFTISPATGYKVADVTVDGVSVGAVSSYTFSNVTSTHTIDATFAVATQTFTITATPATGGIISPSGVTTVSSGGSQTYTISPNAGNQVASVTVDGVSVGAVSNYTFMNVTGNHAIAATFSLPALTVSLGAGVSGTPANSAAYFQGTVVNYSYSLLAGYQNLQVTLDGNPVAVSGTVTMNGSHTLGVTSSAIPSYELTVSLGPGVTGTPATTTTYPQGTMVSYSYTLQPGYQFLYVSLDSGTAPASGTVPMNAAHILAASAQIKTFAINASTGANGTISPSGSTSVNYGGSQLYTITPSVGFQVADVFVDGVSVGAVTTYTFSNVTSAHTIFANFSSPQALLTVSRSVGITGTPATTTSYNVGTVVNYSYALQTGYQNLQVTLDGSPVAASGTVTMNAAHTLAVTAQLQTFTITPLALGNGTISPSGATSVNYGGSQSFNITPSIGYQVAMVEVDGASVGWMTTYSFNNVTSNHTITAYFSPIPTYTLTAGTTANGTISPAGATIVSQGGSQIYTITPNAGYQIGTVTVDGASVGAVTTYTFTNITGNHTIAATFVALPSYALTVSLGLGVSGSPSVTTSYTQGTQANYSYALLPGYSYLMVTLDGTLVPASGTVLMNGTHQLLALNFGQPQIWASAGPNGTISPTANTQVPGSSVYYFITPNAGFQVADVQVDGVSIGAVTLYQFININSCHTISATFY
jgi:hypothetical protein